MSMTTADRIRAALDTLGEGAEEIRKSLKRQRIKGRHGRTTDCPLARFLSANGFERPAVGGGVIVAGMGDEFGFIEARPCEIVFVKAFDAGLYPELVEPAPC